MPLNIVSLDAGGCHFASRKINPPRDCGKPQREAGKGAVLATVTKTNGMRINWIRKDDFHDYK